MPVGTVLARPARAQTVSYSTYVAEAVVGPPQRGLVHSVFHAAANIVFPGAFVLSLNTATSPRMPNGIQLSTLPGTMPVSHLRVGMPVLLGAQRLCIQPLDYTLDLSHAFQWHPRIEHPAVLDMNVVRKNIVWLEQYVVLHPTSLVWEDGRPQGALLRPRPAPVPTIYDHAQHRYIVGTGDEGMWGGAPCGRPSSFEPLYLNTFDPCGRPSSFEPLYLNTFDPCGRPSSFEPLYLNTFDPSGRPSIFVAENTFGPCGRASSHVTDMARALCGRGMGLTPSGDDMLAGWMAIGWLLYGLQPDFLAACQHIVAIARQQTHLLSQCWLECAANGYVAEPIGTLLHALTQQDEQQLEHSSQAVLAMGATSGYDLIQGILLATSEL